MKAVVCETKKLVNIFGEIKRDVESGKVINLAWEAYQTLKTKNQLGFMFGVIVDSIKKALKDYSGEDYTSDQVKEMLYKECSTLTHITFNGNTYEWAIRISDMNKKQMSEFIQKCLDWCDANEVLLPPEARFLWINFLEKPEIEEIAQLKFPDRAPEYLASLRKSHCLICGKYGCEAHHVRLDDGLASTLPDWQATSICDDCHRNQDGAHIVTEQLKEKTKYLPWHLGEKTLLKIMYYHWKQHL